MLKLGFFLLTFGALLSLLMTDRVLACGGVTATIADNPEPLGVRTEMVLQV